MVKAGSLYDINSLEFTDSSLVGGYFFINIENNYVFSGYRVLSTCSGMF